MTTKNVTKYLKFANVQMAANTKGQSQIVLRGAYMNEKSDSMEKKSTPTPGARMASCNIGAYQTKPADSQHNKPAGQSW